MTLINSQSQCRSEFSNTILVAGETAPDYTAGIWTASVSDSAGNTTTDTTSWVVDRQAPVLTLTGPSTGTTGQSLAYTVAHSNLDAGQEIALWTQTLGQVATHKRRERVGCYD